MPGSYACGPSCWQLIACVPVQAHEHAHELYRACPRWCLDWGTRGPGILAEIRHWDPDIGCLQEVDRLEQVQAHLEAHGCACGLLMLCNMLHFSVNRGAAQHVGR